MNDDIDDESLDMVSRQDWDFESVPEDELVAACLWEYARESTTIGMVAEHRWCNTRHLLYLKAYAADPALKIRHDKTAEWIQQRLLAMEFDHDAFCDRYWKTEEAFIGIFDFITSHAFEEARPWLSLPEPLRRQLVGKVGDTSIFQPLRLAMVGELEELWSANREELEAIRAKPRDERDDSDEMAKHQETHPLMQSDTMDTVEESSCTVAFTVDFARFTDNEMVERFQQWLRVSRPEKWRSPRRIVPGARQRGRKAVEYRVALERLGLMRLLHWYSPQELQERAPSAWRKFGRKKDDFRREVRAAERFFHRAFPFLLPRERPKSFERRAVWEREIDRELEAAADYPAESGALNHNPFAAPVRLG